jgi:hypothetical protein
LELFGFSLDFIDISMFLWEITLVWPYLLISCKLE